MVTLYIYIYILHIIIINILIVFTRPVARGSSEGSAEPLPSPPGGPFLVLIISFAHYSLDCHMAG